MAQQLGKLLAVHGVAPAILQRAVFIAVLSFLFFLTMMVVYYIRDNALFFLLATAFLLVYIVTMISFVRGRRGVVQVFEGGIEYNKRRIAWDEIGSVSGSGLITLAAGGAVQLPLSVDRSSELIRLISQRLMGNSEP